MSLLPLDLPKDDAVSAFYELRPALWLDLDTGMLFSETEEMPLTEREIQLLRLLAQALRSPRSAGKRRPALENLVSYEVVYVQGGA